MTINMHNLIALADHYATKHPNNGRYFVRNGSLFFGSHWREGFKAAALAEGAVFTGNAGTNQSDDAQMEDNRLTLWREYRPSA